MTAKLKERIITILINTVVTVGAIFLTFTLNANWNDKKDYETELNNKVDKIDFSEYKNTQVKKWDSHELRHQRDDEADKELIKLINEKFDIQLKAIDKRIDEFKDYMKENK